MIYFKNYSDNSCKKTLRRIDKGFSFLNDLAKNLKIINFNKLNYDEITEILENKNFYFNKDKPKIDNDNDNDNDNYVKDYNKINKKSYSNNIIKKKRKEKTNNDKVKEFSLKLIELEKMKPNLKKTKSERKVFNKGIYDNINIDICDNENNNNNNNKIKICKDDCNQIIKLNKCEISRDKRNLKENDNRKSKNKYNKEFSSKSQNQNIKPDRKSIKTLSNNMINSSSINDKNLVNKIKVISSSQILHESKEKRKDLNKEINLTRNILKNSNQDKTTANDFIFKNKNNNNDSDNTFNHSIYSDSTYNDNIHNDKCTKKDYDIKCINLFDNYSKPKNSKEIQANSNQKIDNVKNIDSDINIPNKINNNFLNKFDNDNINNSTKIFFNENLIIPEIIETEELQSDSKGESERDIKKTKRNFEESSSFLNSLNFLNLIDKKIDKDKGKNKDINTEKENSSSNSSNSSNQKSNSNNNEIISDISETFINDFESDLKNLSNLSNISAEDSNNIIINEERENNKINSNRNSKKSNKNFYNNNNNRENIISNSNFIYNKKNENEIKVLKIKELIKNEFIKFNCPNDNEKEINLPKRKSFSKGKIKSNDKIDFENIKESRKQSLNNNYLFNFIVPKSKDFKEKIDDDENMDDYKYKNDKQRKSKLLKNNNFKYEENEDNTLDRMEFPFNNYNNFNENINDINNKINYKFERSLYKDNISNVKNKEILPEKNNDFVIILHECVDSNNKSII